MHAEFDEKQYKGVISIDYLLQKPFDKHVGEFEIPFDLKGLFDISEINAIITWYLHWKIISNPKIQTTCTIYDIFGYDDGTKVIIAINLYKYLRNKDYDPDIVEEFIKLNKY